jgi:hypothetical protein
MRGRTQFLCCNRRRLLPVLFSLSLWSLVRGLGGGGVVVVVVVAMVFVAVLNTA